MGSRSLIVRRMVTFVNRALSLLVLSGYVVVASRAGAVAVMLKLALPLLLALACVWFPDAFADFLGVIHYHPITTPTHGVVVCVIGWLVLLGLPLIVWYLGRSALTV